MDVETKTKVEEELKRFAADLQLSDTQKTQLKTALENAHEKLEEVRKNNPDVTKADVIAKFAGARDAIRARVTAFLTPEQLKKWDAEAAKARTFLGYNVK
jgi:transcription initiation factor TFIIIB Brf1 subunit/transcription initiation factor TFIIB